MTFSSSIPFREALDFLQSKGLLPTSLSSADLQKLDADIRARALFSARTTNAAYLQEVKDLVDALLQGNVNEATMRLKLKEALQKISYNPKSEEKGTLKDLSSDPRLNLIIQMQSDSAWGYGKYARDQDPAALLAAPAQELFRAEARKEPRNWPQRWMDAGGEFYDGGRMIALKNDPIWTEISVFGQPYPPFDYGSGMWVRDILRPEALALGLLDPDETVAPSNIQNFNTGFQSSIAGLDPDLQQAVLASMGDMVEFIGGILRLKSEI
jgi:hypothetical protein